MTKSNTKALEENAALRRENKRLRQQLSEMIKVAEQFHPEVNFDDIKREAGLL